MRNLFPMLVIATVSAAVPAIAQTAPKPVKEKKICRSGEVPIGSIVPARAICHTKAEWAAIDSAHADEAERTLERNRQQQNSGAGSTR